MFHVKPAYTDHPRSRGVYIRASRPRHCGTGSSPLARGLPQRDVTSMMALGIIPARAGFTCLRSSRRSSSQDHPRSRGVYTRSPGHPASVYGSSPLARGLPHVELDGDLRCGIIPARAGFTNVLNAKSQHTRDHPRSRGVYGAPIFLSVPLLGSSPLARGLRIVIRALILVRRIIPARAGFTCSTPSNSGRNWDYPRSRGVYPSVRMMGRPPVGSSPLARGLHRGRLERRHEFQDHPRSRGVYRQRSGVISHE